MEINFKNVSLKSDNCKVKLSNIDYKFEEKKITAITGPSDSGKSLIIDLMLAFVFSSSGEILIGSEKLDNKGKVNDINKLRFNIGYVFNNPDDMFFLPTVYEEIAFGLKHYNYKLDSLDKTISDSLKIVGLNDSYLNLNPFDLSHGEKKKLSLALVLALNPSVLIIDNPTGGLDSASKKVLIKVLTKLKKNYNKTIIIVSNDVDFIYKFVDNVLVLNNGKILTSGPAKEVYKNSKLLKTWDIEIPEIVEFIEKVSEKKKIKLDMHNDIRELIKDVYRNV